LVYLSLGFHCLVDGVEAGGMADGVKGFQVTWKSLTEVRDGLKSVNGFKNQRKHLPLPSDLLSNPSTNKENPPQKKQNFPLWTVRLNLFALFKSSHAALFLHRSMSLG
jgi:hypothetical protein